MASRVTLRDVAAEAGVHFTTVSLALRNHPRIPKVTRDHIQKIAQRMGWRPDPMLSALTAYRHRRRPQIFNGTIAWLNCHREREGWRKSSHFSAYHKGAVDGAQKLGYQLEEFWYHEPGISPARLSGILRSRNVTGILVVAGVDEPEGPKLDWQHFCGVLVGQGPESLRLPTVSLDQRKTCARAIQEMVRLGHSKLGLIISRDHDRIVDFRYTEAFHLATKVARRCAGHPILYAERDETEKISRWLHKEKPAALLTMPYYPWPEILSATGRAGTPDICLLTTRGSDWELDHHRMVSPGKDVGRAAAALVDMRLRTDDRGIPRHPTRLVFEGEWVPHS